MSISEATLFVSTTSNASIQTLNFIKKTKLPFQIVRLDSVEARQHAANGKHFQIVSVPTMVILYEDGNTQLFLGLPKITQWLTAMMKTKKEEPVRDRRENMYEPEEYTPRDNYRNPRDPRDNLREYDPIDYESGRERPRPKYTSSTLKVRRDSDEDIRRSISKEIPVDMGDDMGDDIMVAEPEEEPEPVIQKPKGRKKKTRKPVQEEPELEDEINPVKIAKEKLNKAASLKSKPQSSKMKGVYSAAKAMEMEMKQSLGYKEEDLPHF